MRPHRRRTPPHPVEDREEIRGFLDSDPIGNAVVWDRVYQQERYDTFVDGDPPAGVLAVQQARRRDGASFIALHASNADAAGALASFVPKGFTILHLTEEFPLAVIEPRAVEFNPHLAWLFRLEADDFVDVPDPRVRPLDPVWAGQVAKLWEPEWPAEGYVRRRSRRGRPRQSMTTASRWPGP